MDDGGTDGYVVSSSAHVDSTTDYSDADEALVRAQDEEELRPRTLWRNERWSVWRVLCWCIEFVFTTVMGWSFFGLAIWFWLEEESGWGTACLFASLLWWLLGLPSTVWQLLAYGAVALCGDVCGRRTVSLSQWAQGEAQHMLEHGRVPIVYRSEYNVRAGGLERFHWFDPHKYGRIASFLVQDNVLQVNAFVRPPRMPTRSEMLLVHNPLYLSALNSPLLVTMILGVPLIPFLPLVARKSRILEPMLWATSGSIIAAELALERGWSINLSGGYHHAYGTRASMGGFCVYADITLMIRHLRLNHGDRAKRVCIVDLDAHQGNGHERDFLGDPNTFIIDMYNEYIYPGDDVARGAIRGEVKLNARTGWDRVYLERLNGVLEEAFAAFDAHFVVYNAGTDCMVGDPLGGMRLSGEAIVARDEAVWRAAMTHNVPIVQVMSGGYQKSNARTIATSIANLRRVFELF